MTAPILKIVFLLVFFSENPCLFNTVLPLFSQTFNFTDSMLLVLLFREKPLLNPITIFGHRVSRSKEDALQYTIGVLLDFYSEYLMHKFQFHHSLKTRIKFFFSISGKQSKLNSKFRKTYTVHSSLLHAFSLIEATLQMQCQLALITITIFAIPHYYTGNSTVDNLLQNVSIIGNLLAV